MKELNEEESFTLPVTPLVNIGLLVLIFLLLAAAMRKEERPVMTAEATASAARARVFIGVLKDGTYTLNGTPVEEDELRGRLAEALKGKDKPQISLRSAREAGPENIAEVLQLCNELGVDKVSVDFGFATVP